MRILPYLASAMTAVALLALDSSALASTNTTSSASYQMGQVGQDYVVWQRVTPITNNAGAVTSHTNHYVELETGKFYLQNGGWLPSSAEIHIAGSVAVATNGPHKVAFAANINSPVSLRVLTPDGKRLQMRPLGLAYYDFQAATNPTVMIAELKDSIGQLISSNQVLYSDAFSNLTADIRYTYKKSGLEQDVILRQRPPLPQEYGYNPASTRLLLFTEFIDLTNTVTPLRQIRHGWKKATVDKVVDFGAMKIGHGSAFKLGASGPGLAAVPVQKHWTVLEGRTFLIEELNFPRISGSLSTLQASLPPRNSGKTLLANHAPRKFALPERPLAAAAGNAHFQVAAAPPQQSGLLLDFDLESGMGIVLQGDTTYVVTGTVNLTNVVIEGGAVVKYNSGASLQLYSPPVCLTGPYRPALFTAIDDNTVGEVLGSGAPSGPYATRALSLQVGGALQYLNIRYAGEAVYCANNDYSVSHSQIQFCDCGFHSETANFTNCNVLMSVIGTNFYGSYFEGRVEHLTADQAQVLASDPNFGFLGGCNGVPSSSLTLVNSITTAISGGYAASPLSEAIYVDHVQDYPSGDGIYQTVGAGSYYLVDGSTNRSAGTSAIEPALAAALAMKTTYPPLVYAGVTISSDTNFSPRAPRDSSASPDLGYNYDVMDWAFGGVEADANLTFSPGTAVGFFSTAPAGQSIHLGDTYTANFQGTAQAPDYWARYCTVQEGGNGNWTDGYGAAGSITGSAQSSDAAPMVSMRFTKCSEMSYGSCFVRDDSGQIVTHARDCEFYNAGFGGWVVTVALTNCLLDRCSVVLNGGVSPNQVTLQNCTMLGTVLSIDRWPEDWGSPGTGLVPVTIVNSAFDGTSISTSDAQSGNSSLTYMDFNAFAQGANQTHPAGSHIQVVTNFNWQTSCLGKYYLPSDSLLKDHGNTTADQVGLYHYTTQTNFVSGRQQIEGTTQVDIGYHEVAVDAYGNPIDTDGDGTPDYLEDVNGNGDGSDDPTSWTVYDSPNGLVNGSGLEVFTPLQ